MKAGLGGGGGCRGEGETQPAEARLLRVMTQWREGGGWLGARAQRRCFVCGALLHIKPNRRPN